MENIDHILQVAKLENDIREIERFFSNLFDRQEAIRIIKKHHFTDCNIAIADLFLQVNLDTLFKATPQTISNYIRSIELYLMRKLKDLQNAGSDN